MAGGSEPGSGFKIPFPLGVWLMSEISPVAFNKRVLNLAPESAHICPAAFLDLRPLAGVWCSGARTQQNGPGAGQALRETHRESVKSKQNKYCNISSGTVTYWNSGTTKLEQILPSWDPDPHRTTVLVQSLDADAFKECVSGNALELWWF